jgi:hypothetical protein
MAVQSKTLIGDVGSAVLSETISQLNRAAGYASSSVHTVLTDVPADMAFVICKFTEDVWVTSVEFGFGALTPAAINHAADAVALAVGTNPDGTGGLPVCTASNFTVPFATTDAWATMTDLQAVAADGTGDAPFPVTAGDALAIQFDLNAASQVVTANQVLESINVTYRPVKDYITSSPSYTKTMQNWKSVDR